MDINELRQPDKMTSTQRFFALLAVSLLWGALLLVNVITYRALYACR
jgi:hypothetical protein